MLNLTDASRINNLCLYAADHSYAAKATLSGAFNGTATIVASLDLKGNSTDIAAVRNLIWKDLKVLDGVTVNDALRDRFVPGKFWAGSELTSSGFTVSPCTYSISIAAGAANGTLVRNP